MSDSPINLKILTNGGLGSNLSLQNKKSYYQKEFVEWLKIGISLL